jgi:hypothetical protein
MTHRRDAEDAEKKGGGLKPEDPTSNAVFENWNIEVDEQANFPAAQAEIG